MRPLIDVIEELGAAVAIGAIDIESACDRLRQYARAGLVTSLNRLYDNS